VGAGAFVCVFELASSKQKRAQRKKSVKKVKVLSAKETGVNSTMKGTDHVLKK
jgi:hypothetical protein